jgi:PAP2 superfamily
MKDVRRQGTSSRINSPLLLVLLTVMFSVRVVAAVPDPVLQWIDIMNTTVLAGGTNPLATTRVVALVSGSMFDAVNGIDPRFAPLHVTTEAPASASQRAAAVQAAFVMLVKLYPAQSGALKAQRDASIAAIAAQESAASVTAGVQWGQRVASAFWGWRLSDGLSPEPPPFRGVESLAGTPAAVGAWRPTPPFNASGAAPQFASMTPWVIIRPSQFRLPPPLALSSAEYLADYNEVRTMGVFDGSGRSSDQSELALFWAGNTPLYWNRIALQIAAARSLTLSQNAHLFALMNVAIADAGIACWDSKYRYVFWRPITAIRDPGSVNSDAAWIPWLPGTPAHPEYPSGHSTVSGAAAFILSQKFGDSTAFTVTSDVRPGTRSFPSFSAAVAEIADARVFGGIHYRTSCARGNLLGQSVGHYVLVHAMR